MQIVIVSAVFPPEPVVSARMGWDLANFFSSRGHIVTVLCPQPSRPFGADYGQCNENNTVTMTQEGGFEVVRLPSYRSPRSLLFQRFWESLSFGRHVCRFLTMHMKSQPDVLYINAWPLFAQALIVRFAKINGLPVVLQVMDIYPESLLNKLPTFFHCFVSAPLIKLDSWIVRNVYRVVVISEKIRTAYIQTREVSPEKIDSIPIWQDESIFDPLPERKQGCMHYGVSEKYFTFLYLGNIGPVAGVDFLIKAFHNAKLSNAQLLIVGDGTEKTSCQDLVSKLSVDKVFFISDPDINNVPLLQSMAHVCLLPMKKSTGLSSVPSKLVAYLFSAKPVLATVDHDSDIATVIRDAKCGWVGPSEDLGWLSYMMEKIISLPASHVDQLGKNARDYGYANYSKKIGVERISEVLLASCK